MKRAILAATVAIAFLAGVSAQDRPNFTGTWKSANSYTLWTITVEGTRMTLTQTMAGNSDSTVYLLDGTPSKKAIEGPNGRVENVATTAWEGEVLVTTIKTGFGHTIVEKRWLEPDGTMRVQNTLSFPDKPSPPAPPPNVLKRIK